jgi:4-amino-4-deoxy-L-arabinose transferase-like glycosyltransferase
MVAPIVVAATIAIGLVYGLGAALYGRVGGRIAAALLVATPLDFAWSTMLTPDMLLSVCLAASMLCLLRAATAEDRAWRRRLLAISAVALWLGFHAKVSGALMGAVLVLVWWRHRATLWRDLDAFVAPAALLFGGTVLVCYVLTGDPIAPYTIEVTSQGLTGKTGIEFHRVTRYVFWRYVDWLFWPTAYGDRFFALWPHLVVVFGVLAWFTRLRAAPEPWLWLVILFLGMQFNIQRTEGVWVAGFRNVRHIHPLVHPLVLVLAGYLASIARRAPRAGFAVVAVLVGYGLWQSVSVATKTHVSFADRRAVAPDPARWRLVREFPAPIGPTIWRPEPLRLWETGPPGTRREPTRPSP